MKNSLISNSWLGIIWCFAPTYLEASPQKCAFKESGLCPMTDYKEINVSSERVSPPPPSYFILLLKLWKSEKEEAPNKGLLPAQHPPPPPHLLRHYTSHPAVAWWREPGSPSCGWSPCQRCPSASNLIQHLPARKRLCPAPQSLTLKQYNVACKDVS